MGRVSNIQEFIEKYSLDNSKKPSSWELRAAYNDNKDEVIADYEALDARDRYAVFTILQDSYLSEILYDITDFDSSQKVGFSKLHAPVDKILEDLKTDLSQKPSQDPNQIWEKRLSVLESTYELNQWMVFYSAMTYGVNDQHIYKWNLPLQALYNVNDHIKLNLGEIYRETATQGKNTFWDTDEDFNPYNTDKRDWENYFDDKDSDPLSSKGYKDTDQDGIADSIDERPLDNSEWIDLEIGETREVQGGRKRYHVTRIGSDEFKVSLDINLYLKTQNSHLSTPQKIDEELKEISQRLSENYSQISSDKNCTFVFDIKLLAVMSENDADVIVSDDQLRDTASHWKTRSLLATDLRVVMHETGHILGMPDYYHEDFTHERLREKVLLPGFQFLLSGSHLMQSGKEFSAREMQSLILSARFYNLEKDRLDHNMENKGKSMPSPQDDYTVGCTFIDIIDEPTNPEHWLSYIGYLFDVDMYDSALEAFKQMLQALKFYQNQSQLTYDSQQKIHKEFITKILPHLKKYSEEKLLVKEYSKFIKEDIVQSAELYNSDYIDFIDDSMYESFLSQRFKLETDIANYLTYLKHSDRTDFQKEREKIIKILKTAISLKQFDAIIEFLDSLYTYCSDKDLIRSLYLQACDLKNYDHIKTYFDFYEKHFGKDSLINDELNLFEKDYLKKLDLENSFNINAYFVWVKYLKNLASRCENQSQKSKVLLRMKICINSFQSYEIKSLEDGIVLLAFFTLLENSEMMIKAYKKIMFFHFYSKTHQSCEWSFDRVMERIKELNGNKFKDEMLNLKHGLIVELDTDDVVDSIWIERYYYHELSGFDIARIET